MELDKLYKIFSLIFGACFGALIIIITRRLLKDKNILRKKSYLRSSLIELATSILFLISYLKFGANYNTIIFDLIIVVCLIIFITDLESYIMPDLLQFILLILNLLFVYYNSYNIFCCIISSFAYFTLFYITSAVISETKNKAALGGGDLKFIISAGLLLNLRLLPNFLFISGVIGLVFGKIWTKINKNDYFPFGPALIIAFIFLMFHNN